MFRFFMFLIIVGCIYFGFQAGWFNSVIDYFQNTVEKSKQETVYHNSDGSYTKVRYKNVIDLIFGQ